MSQIIEAAKCGEYECAFKWPAMFGAGNNLCTGPKCAAWTRLVFIVEEKDDPPDHDSSFYEASTREEQERSTHGRCGLSSR